MLKINNYLQGFILLLLAIYTTPLLINSIKKQWSHKIEKHHKIGYLFINETIKNASPYRKYLTDYFKNTSIKAILIKIESDAGATGSCQALAHEIEYLKKEYPKPIICYIENICTSGAYQVAAATDYIIATGSCIIGNIGMNNISTEKNNNTLNANFDLDKNTNQQKHNNIDKLSDNIYQQITKEIASKRHLQLNKIDQWGQGQLFTGQQAYDLKLVDAIGSKTTAINLLKKNIIPSDLGIEWITPYTPNIIETFFNAYHDENDDLDSTETSYFSSLINNFYHEQQS